MSDNEKDVFGNRTADESYTVMPNYTTHYRGPNPNAPFLAQIIREARRGHVFGLCQQCRAYAVLEAGHCCYCNTEAMRR